MESNDESNMAPFQVEIGGRKLNNNMISISQIKIAATRSKKTLPSFFRKEFKKRSACCTDADLSEIPCKFI
jgi:hypothetical protein